MTIIRYLSVLVEETSLLRVLYAMILKIESFLRIGIHRQYLWQ